MTYQSCGPRNPLALSAALVALRSNEACAAQTLFHRALAAGDMAARSAELGPRSLGAARRRAHVPLMWRSASVKTRSTSLKGGGLARNMVSIRA